LDRGFNINIIAFILLSFSIVIDGEKVDGEEDEDGGGGEKESPIVLHLDENEMRKKGHSNKGGRSLQETKKNSS